MKALILALSVIAINNVCGQSQINDYADFLKEQKSPKEYIFQLSQIQSNLTYNNTAKKQTTE